MAKLTAPLFSFGARGQLAKALVFFPWKGVNAVRQHVIPANPNTALQAAQRVHMTGSVAAWHVAAFTAADVVAYNRMATVLAGALSGFNVFIRTRISRYRAGLAPPVLSDVQVDTPTVNGFDVDVENCVQGYSLRAVIGTRATHFPTEVALVDDLDDTYSLTWAGGVTATKYYVKIQYQEDTTWYDISGIYSITTD